MFVFVMVGWKKPFLASFLIHFAYKWHLVVVMETGELSMLQIWKWLFLFFIFLPFPSLSTSSVGFDGYKLLPLSKMNRLSKWPPLNCIDAHVFLLRALSDGFRRRTSSRHSAAAVWSQKEAADERRTAPPLPQVVPLLGWVHRRRSEPGRSFSRLDKKFGFRAAFSCFQARRATWIQTGWCGCWTARWATRGRQFVTPEKPARANRITTGWLGRTRTPSSSGEPQKLTGWVCKVEEAFIYYCWEKRWLYMENKVFLCWK